MAAPRRRRSVRLPEYDYRNAGAYFVTIVTRGRECLFGRVTRGEAFLTPEGQAAAACWRALPSHFPHVEIDAFVVMPNHIHGILVFHGIRDRRGAACCAPTPDRPRQFGDMAPGSLSVVVRSFKSATAREVNRIRNTPGASIWQRNYHEHVVRNADGLNRIRAYIHDNPAHWATDDLHPDSP